MNQSNQVRQDPIVSTIVKIGILLMMVVGIIQVFPHKTKSFSYRYEEGKPWSDELLTAEFDFPIYKTEQELLEQQQEALSRFAPYYTIEETVNIQDMLSGTSLKPSTARHLRSQVEQIYQAGVLSIEDTKELRRQGYQQITIVDRKHIARVRPIASCFTPRTAYDTILAQVSTEEKSAVQALNLNAWLRANLRHDTLSSNTMRQQLLSEVSPTRGMVQAGEKIIDRGEVVTKEHIQILHSLKIALEEQGVATRSEWGFVAGNLILIVSFVGLLLLYLTVFRPKLFHDINAMLFFAILMAIIIAAACLVKRFTTLSIYIVPFAWVPVIIRVFYDSRTALYVHLVTTLICAIISPDPFEFLVLQVAVGMVAVSSLRDMAQRAQLAQTAAWILLAYCVGYTGFTLATLGDWHLLSWQMYVYFVCNALLIIFSYGLIYIFEKSFHLLSNITLVELTNLNSSFMMEFAEKAPGTFQHSLQVGNLAMEAAKRIGANTLLVRTGALYHDIGKLASPQNYTENQQDGENPLSKMSYIRASQAVISHVEEGVKLAKQLHLPSVVVQFILSHHGTSVTRFFYNSYCNEHPGGNIDPSVFQYPGPKPSSKEAAILMMADAVEARSRSLSEYTEESISQMVDQMIAAQLNDGQFEETSLTFKDILLIKQCFTKKIIAMNHHRISYPELQK